MNRKDLDFEIQQNGCWVCISHKLGSHGYPQIQRKGKQWCVHRYIWQTYVSSIPEGMYILHTCDNPLCINPDHLYVGTQQDNVWDRGRRGRTANGERNGNAKLTFKDVCAIRSRTAGGETQVQIAKDYPVEQQTISYIVRRQYWSRNEPS